uniref:Uncharacterized protein n=1 Tax=Avena sativa TaxID=4498 RepID=A0ACD5Y9T5_AVESA
MRAHMTIDELRQELLHEDIRQQFILAELAKRWELEAEFQRELSLYGDVRARFWQTTMPHHGTSPLPHGEPLDVPQSLAEASMLRPHIKDRIMEWYQPPWRRTVSEDDAPIVGANLRQKAVSGVKRKRTAETLSLMCSICNTKCYCETDLENHLRGRRHQENIEALQGGGKGNEAKLREKKVPQLAEKSQKPVPRWMCSICNANCTSQPDLENHLGGRRHQENIEALQGEGKGTEAKLHDKKVPQLADKRQKPVSRWMCSICYANCTSQSDLENHLGGRRHKEDIEALQGEGKGAEAKLHENKAPQLVDKSHKPVSRWMCRSCNANCTSQSDLESHIQGRRHQENIEALLGGGNGTESKLQEKKTPQLADRNQKPVSRWMCSICNANCTCPSDLESHLGGRRHQENMEALCGGGKGTEAKLYGEKAPQLADRNQKPVSRWMCSICNANCTSPSDLESHLGGRRHQENIEALRGGGKGTEAKLYGEKAPQVADRNQKPVSRWMCNICNANCTCPSDLESHLGGRRHQENIEALRGGGKGTEAKLYEKKAPQLVGRNQKPPPRRQKAPREHRSFHGGGKGTEAKLMKRKRRRLWTGTRNLASDGCAASAVLIAHLDRTWRATSEAEGTERTCKPKLSGACNLDAVVECSAKRSKTSRKNHRFCNISGLLTLQGGNCRTSSLLGLTFIRLAAGLDFARLCSSWRGAYMALHWPFADAACFLLSHPFT